LKMSASDDLIGDCLINSLIANVSPRQYAFSYSNRVI
jgi:hypothetical protein